MTDWTEISKKQYDEFGKTPKAPAETQQILLEEENKDLKWQQKYEKEHKLRREAEGEMTIIKGIGMNSPEMRALQEQVKEAGRINKLHQELIEKLKAELARAKEDHQYDNLVHQKELESLRKK